MQAQTPSPYELKWAKETPLVLGGLIGGSVSVVLKKRKVPLTEAQLNQLDINGIPRFDRWPTRNWDTNAQKASDVMMFTAMAAPLVLLLDKNIRNDFGTVGTIAFETYLINGMLTNLTKELVRRKRPYLYNSNAPLHKKQEADATSSFFSGHTSVSASATFMLAKIYSDYHPNSKYKPLVWTTAALIPAITAFLRIKGGKHFPSDVIVGYIAGASVGVLIPVLHHKKNN